MTIATVQDVTLSMLVLNENDATEEELVVVTLERSTPVTGTNYYLGDMKYKSPEGQVYDIDMVSANFLDDDGAAAGTPGKVKLEVSLQDGNTFQEPFVTITPTGETLSELHCIEISDDNPGSTALLITFLEPQKDEAIAYPSLYFHTAEGVIDPTLGVSRRPPQ